MKSLSSCRVGITSGPTRAWLDPVRYIANASTGRLGALLATGFADKGASVDYVSGPGACRPTESNICCHDVETPSDLLRLLRELSRSKPSFDFWIHAMAVLDYVPQETRDKKIPSDTKTLEIRLVPTPKIINEFKRLFSGTFLVGFKLETTTDTGLLKSAAKALTEEARCDLVVANPVPFMNPEAHQAFLWNPRDSSWTGPFTGKSEISRGIRNWAEQALEDDVLPL